jgi:hypothetical protein
MALRRKHGLFVASAALSLGAISKREHGHSQWRHSDHHGAL